MFTVNRNSHKKTQNAAATHRESLRKNLEHRLDVARANGDESLVRQLEAEAKYLRLD